MRLKRKQHGNTKITDDDIIHIRVLLKEIEKNMDQLKVKKAGVFSQFNITEKYYKEKLKEMMR